MQQFETIHYLRWARAQALPPHPEISLILSGMTTPSAELLGGFDTADLLQFAVEDHPPLAHRLAEAWKVAPERVLVQPGSHWSILLLVAARLAEHPGPVVVEDPAYEPLLRITVALGAEVLRLPRPRASSFALDRDALGALADRRPSLLLLSQPHNPTGTVLNEADTEALREFQARSGGCAVLSDEVYVEFCPDWPVRTLLDRLDDVAVIRSFTKVLGLGGLRCSASVGPADWIARAAAITDHGAVALPAPAQAVAVRAWERRRELWDRARSAATAGRAEVAGWLHRVEGLVDAHLPEAGIICFPVLSEELHGAATSAAARAGIDGPFGFGLDAHHDASHRWIEHLRRETGVQLTPGEFFGDRHAFRLGYGLPADAVREGLARIERYFRMVMEEA